MPISGFVQYCEVTATKFLKEVDISISEHKVVVQGRVSPTAFWWTKTTRSALFCSTNILLKTKAPKFNTIS